MRAEDRTRIGYVVRRFPVLSETFVLNEILEVEAQGVKTEIFSLLQPRDSRFHAGVAQLDGPIRYIPGVVDFKDLWRYNRRAHARFGAHYRRMLFWAVTRLRPALVWRFLQAAYVAERAAERKLDHLHAHFANRTATVARLAARLAGISYSFTAHAFDIYKQDIESHVLRRKIEEAAFVVTVSDGARDFLAGVANGSAAKICRVYNGIDLDRFSPAPPRTDRRLNLLAIARLQEKKGLGYLIDACAILQSRGIDFRCRIVGQGRLRPVFKQQIAALDLGRKVKLVGTLGQDQVAQEYAGADLFVLPCVVGGDGNRDGLPVSIVEALASGVPVISTAISGIPEVVKDGVNGRIVPQRDPEALADAIAVLANDREALARLAEAARASVAADFDRRLTAASLRQRFEAARRTSVEAAE